MGYIPPVKIRSKNSAKSQTRSGFTLVELLVVIAIVAVLVALSFVGIGKFIENGRKVQALAQFKDLEIGLKMFETDYNRPPVPLSKRAQAEDTVYGDPGGIYKNDFVIAALIGEEKDFPYDGESFSVKDVNPRGEKFLELQFSPDKKNGVAKDGNLYDPWGNTLIIAINAPPFSQDFNGGRGDRRMHTYETGEYKETKPREQSFVFWSYGKDGKKGKGGTSPQAIVPYAGSDDVISW
jgi:prepilin-type N-terminal cleavage/methylation domain-containing protein